MAATFVRRTGPYVQGNKRRTATDVTFDSSYATNGYAFTANNLGLGVVEELTTQFGAVTVKVDYTNSKLVCFFAGAATPSVLTECTATTNLSAVTGTVMAVGY